MHASAYKTAHQFFEVYASAFTSGTVVEIGSRQVAAGQRTLRALCPPHLDYLGIDLEPGINVDIVLTDPYVFPLPETSVDIVICTSVFEHCDFFWELFVQVLHILKPGGLLYVNAPSNGYVHRHPVDCWRFYPDSGIALAEWGRRQGHDVALLESFITDADLSENTQEIWNDFVAVFIKGSSEASRYAQRLMNLRDDYMNARRLEQTELLCTYPFPARSHDQVLHRLSSQHNSRRVCLYQIAYSEETWNNVPRQLFPLDNRSNERPDWAEYWPIRRFLLNETLDENAFYGFLSPRFSEKLLCSPEDLIPFIASVPDDVDVVAFSPFFDIGALFRNVFEQGEYCHPGLMDLSIQVVDEIMPEVDLHKLINTSANTIFCNYFAAKPRFWRRWLELGERVFAMAESPQHRCAPSLCRGYFHRNETMPAKVFVIERLASLLLGTTNEFKVAKFEIITRTQAFEEIPFALLVNLDALKSQAVNGHPMLLNAFNHIQREILEGERARMEQLWVLSKNVELRVGHVPSRGYEHWGNAQEAASQEHEQIGLWWLLKRLIR